MTLQHAIEQGLVLEPTLRDLLIQHMGVEREMAYGDPIAEAVMWVDYLALVLPMSDADLFAQGRRFHMKFRLIVERGESHRDYRQRASAMGMEVRNHYHTPRAAEHCEGYERRLAEELQTRKTAGCLREMIVADIDDSNLIVGDLHQMYWGTEKLIAISVIARIAKERGFSLADYQAQFVPPERDYFDDLSDWRLLQEWAQTCSWLASLRYGLFGDETIALA
jgi:hypothetical protein